MKLNTKPTKNGPKHRVKCLKCGMFFNINDEHICRTEKYDRDDGMYLGRMVR